MDRKLSVCILKDVRIHFKNQNPIHIKIVIFYDCQKVSNMFKSEEDRGKNLRTTRCRNDRDHNSLKFV